METQQMKSFINLLVFTNILGFSITNCQSQEYLDCTTAYEACHKGPFVFEPLSIETGIADSGVESSCIGAESFPTWIRIDIGNEGDMTFVLTPENGTDDLDFVLYQLGSCDNKTSIRCMASGESSGMNSELCQGATGLLSGETDLEEASGCEDGSNNFLAPVDAKNGDLFILLVNNFSSTGQGFNLEFGGSASFKCLTSTEDVESVESIFRLTPNFIHTGTMTLSILDEAWYDSDLLIYDINSKLIEEKKIFSDIFINSEKFSTGQYQIILQKNGKTITERFIKF